MSHLATQLGYSAGKFQALHWLSLRRLVFGVWINHLPPAYIFIFYILTYAIPYVLIHHIICRLYLYFLNNFLYFFKYSWTNILHRRSLYTLYCEAIKFFQYAKGLNRLYFVSHWFAWPTVMNGLSRQLINSMVTFNTKTAQYIYRQPSAVTYFT